MAFTLKAPCTHQEEIRKSRFLAQAAPVSSAAEAQAFIQLASDPGASHNCWAWKVGQQYRSSDDGEPGGTAGRPMLDVLRHQDLEGVLATVVRYFGGVKLGAGGLVRAYTDTVAQALLTAPKIILQRMHTLQCQVPYALEGLLRREIEVASAELLQVQHASLVTLQIRLPEAQAAAFVQHINDHGQGRVGWMRHDA